MYSACRGLKRASEPLELELLTIVATLKVLRTKPGFHATAVNVLNTEPFLHPHIDALFKTHKIRIKGNFSFSRQNYLTFLNMFNLLAPGKLKLQALTC